MQLYKLKPESEKFVFSFLPKNIRGDDLTRDAFYFIYAIARFDGVENGKDLYDTYKKYAFKFIYDHLEPYTFCKNIDKNTFIYNAGKTLTRKEGIDELCKMYFLANEKNKQKIINIFDKELF